MTGPLAMPTCRFCHEHRPGRRGEFIQYAPRQYAHTKCYLAAGKSLDALAPEERAKFPRWLLRRYGIYRKD
jgi:hypothetical protein